MPYIYSTVYRLLTDSLFFLDPSDFFINRTNNYEKKVSTVRVNSSTNINKTKEISTVRVNSSTNIIKTNNHISPQILEHKEDWHTVRFKKYRFLALDRHKNVMGLNQITGFQPSPLDNWISNGNTCT